ncbi:MAG: DUF4386 family protein [Phycicoccus sp.]
MSTAAAPTTVLATGGPPLPRRGTGLLLLASAVLAATGAILLGAVFDWPAVLDQPGTVALPMFAEAEGAIRLGFTLELLSSLVLVPAAIGLRHALGRGGSERRDVAARIVAMFGIAGALFQMLGWVRWPVAVPGLSERFADPAADEVSRAATAAAYDVLNAYAGGAVGEFLGWLFQAPWAIGVPLLALAVVGVPRWFAWVGVLAAVAWVPLIVPEPYVEVLGSDAVSAVSFGIYTIWYVWLGALGVLLTVRRVGGIR